MEQLWRFITLVAMIVVMFGFLTWWVYGGEEEHADKVLPLVAIGGVVVLIIMVTAVTMTFSFMGLANPNQAMGLPDGSIRAMLALSLVVLFAILAVFLYRGVYVGGPKSTIQNLSQTDVAKFLADRPTAREIRTKVAKSSDGADVYDLTYRSDSAASDEFAKQLLVLLGTLMTAVTSFYLGAGTATSAATGAAQGVSLTVNDIDPTAHSIGNDGPVIHLRVMGNNLNTITHVKIVRAGVQVIGTNVASNPSSVTCDIPVSATTTPPGPPWDVVVDDGASKSASLPGALTINL